MKRKLLSFAIAFALLSQTIVSAGALKTALHTHLGNSVADNLSARNVVETVTSGVKTAGSIEEYASSTTSKAFDYYAEIDMLEVRKAFVERYKIAEGIKTATSMSDSIWNQFLNSKITGEFEITFTNPAKNIKKSDDSPLVLADINLPTDSIFKVSDVDTNNYATDGTVKVTVKVIGTDSGDTSYCTVQSLKSSFDSATWDSTNPVSTKLGKIRVGLNGLEASDINSVISVSMKGYTDFTEPAYGTDDTYARINYESQDPDSFVTVYQYVGGHGPSSPSTDNSTPTPPPAPPTTGGDDSGSHIIPSVDNTDNTGTIASGDTATGGTTTTTTNADGSTTTTTTTENSTTTTTTKENSDGSTTTTATQTSENKNSDGSTTTTEITAESNTSTNSDGSTTTTATQTSTSTTTNQDGSSVKTETKKDVTTTTNADGSSTSTVKEQTTSSDGIVKNTETNKTTDTAGNTTAKTTETTTQTQKTDDGSTVVKNTTGETTATTNVVTNTTTVTKTETTETTTKAKDGTETKTTTTTEASKTTDVNNGTSSSTITETTTSKDGAEKTVTETKNEVANGVLNSVTEETVTTVNDVVGDTSRTTTSTSTRTETSTKTTTVKEEIIQKPGFIAAGWSDKPYGVGDPNYKGESTIDIPVTETTTETTTYLADENGDPVVDENGDPVVVSTETVTTITRPSVYASYVNITVPEALEQEKDENGNPMHKVYIAGYPDGEVKPNNNITREEVTAALDRLLNIAFRANIATTEQDFPDVNNDRWSNESIATMAKGGFIVGDENGNFNPSKPITRAEFAVIASKFAPIDAEPAENYFTDIDGHWAKDFILKVTGQYWISGYTDGTFDPDAPITRAEAMTIINRMLVRYGDGDAEHVTEWPDVDESDWYYEQVIEATTHNVYVRTENGWSEKWVEE